MYVVMIVIVHLMFPMLAYQPPRPSYSDEDSRVFKLTTRTGASISAIHHKNPNAQYTVLYSHGNATDIGYANGFMVMLRDAGFNVLAYDYQGYGTSESRPSEKRSYDDINAAYHYLTEILMIPESSIILYGSSIGTGPTMDLATRTEPGGVILESPMLSAYRVMTQLPIFPFDKYKNADKLSAVQAPLLIIYGEKDRTIPPWHGKHLFKKALGLKFILPVPGAGHNDLFAEASGDIMEKIKEFAAAIASS